MTGCIPRSSESFCKASSHPNYLPNDSELVYSGYDLSKALSYDRAALGCLGKLPIELIALIFDATDLDGAAMLCVTHAQLFAIGYSSTLAKAKTIALSNNWAYDRIICIGDYSDSLPAGFLSPAEKHRLMKWWITRKAGLDGEVEDTPLDDIGGATGSEDGAAGERKARDSELDEALAAFEDQSFHLYTYGRDMPMLRDISVAGSWSTELERDHIYRMKTSPVDAKRLRLTSTVMRFNPYDPHTPPRSYNCDWDTAVFINTTKREFVPAMDEQGEWVLDMAIPVLSVWGHEDGYGDMMKGKWAGDRLAIISAEELEGLMQEEDGWTERKERWATEPA